MGKNMNLGVNAIFLVMQFEGNQKIFLHISGLDNVWLLFEGEDPNNPVAELCPGLPGLASSERTCGFVHVPTVL